MLPYFPFALGFFVGLVHWDGRLFGGGEACNSSGLRKVWAGKGTFLFNALSMAGSMLGDLALCILMTLLGVIEKPRHLLRITESRLAKQRATTMVSQ